MIRSIISNKVKFICLNIIMRDNLYLFFAHNLISFRFLFTNKMNSSNTTTANAATSFAKDPFSTKIRTRIVDRAVGMWWFYSDFASGARPCKTCETKRKTWISLEKDLLISNQLSAKHLVSGRHLFFYWNVVLSDLTTLGCKRLWSSRERE